MTGDKHRVRAHRPPSVVYAAIVCASFFCITVDWLEKARVNGQHAVLVQQIHARRIKDNRCSGMCWSFVQFNKDIRTNRRYAIGVPLAVVVEAIIAPSAVNALVDSAPTFRTLQQVPEIPVETAVILLRTTAEAIVDFGCFKDNADWQAKFSKERMATFASFKSRYQNYDLTGLYNQSILEVKDPRTNRLYFNYLNLVQFQAIGKTITRKGQRLQVSRIIGDRLYDKILRGDVVGPRTIGTDEEIDKGTAEVNMSSTFSGVWPAITSPLPRGKGKSPEELKSGVRQLLEYLRSRKYCKEFAISDFTPNKDGGVDFVSYIQEPVNLEATVTLTKGDNILPRYESGILQAYFKDCGYDSDIKDGLAAGMDDWITSAEQRARGIRAAWTLRPRPDDDA